MTYMHSILWKLAFEGNGSESHKELSELLKGAYVGLRRQAETLVSNIGADLRQYTIHDITHLDALWGVASEIVGPNVDLNPVEGFILGASFLLHDAGMCLAAYPGGLEELKGHRFWLTALRRVSKNSDAPTEPEVSAAVVEVIRAEHANRARDLPNVEWVSPSGARYYLIESTDLRRKFANAIGDVAASHWWSHDRLALDLDRVLPAPPPFPTEWRADLLKIAAILRVADAAHIDERRAPGFAWALRGASLSATSNLHWLFQNRITQPERRDDALYYSSTSDFSPSDADAWWLASDTLRMIDRELRSTDVLLADLRGAKVRLAARRVANVESTATMVMSIRVQDWIPFDTSIKISDVPGLIRSLGGEALYGDSHVVPLRELLQNAADAVRLKAGVLPEFKLSDGLIEVFVGSDSEGTFLQVTDNGIGMSRDVLGGAFLDFGNSGWSSDPVFLDYPSVDPQKLNMIGKFGIGFFSIFMLGDKVEVATRRFDKGFHDTMVLSFSSGIGRRPILRRAEKSEWMVKGGTSVKVWIRDKSTAETALVGANKTALWGECKRQFPLSDTLIRVWVEGALHDLEPIDWRSAEPEVLFKRTSGSDTVTDFIRRYLENMRPIYDKFGEVAGRMFIAPGHPMFFSEASPWIGVQGMVVSRGVYVSSIGGIGGVVESDVMTADRNLAWPKPSKEEFYRWLAEQADLIADMGVPDEEEASCANTIRRLGGDARDLKFIRTKGGFLSMKQLREFVSRSEELRLVFSFEVWNLKKMNPTAIVEQDLLIIDLAHSRIFDHSATMPGRSFDSFLADGRYGGMVDIIGVLADSWGIDEAVVEAIKIGQVDGMPIHPSVVFARGASGEEIRAYGWRCWRGMSIEDLRLLSASSSA